MPQSLAHHRAPFRDATEEALDAIREHLNRVRFGSLSITLHDGAIVQLEVTEKHRFAPAPQR